MNVSDIMIREVITVNKETSLQEAAGILAKFRIHGFPVVEDDNKVIGIITESDFFTKDSSNIFLPTFLRFIRSEKMKNQREVDSKEIEKKTKVEDIMTKDCFTVQPETTVEELIQYCKEKNFNSFPVTNEQGILVGIVTIMDVIKLL
jgi:CBS domain-containing protein